MLHEFVEIGIKQGKDTEEKLIFRRNPLEVNPKRTRFVMVVKRHHYVYAFCLLYLFTSPFSSFSLTNFPLQDRTNEQEVAERLAQRQKSRELPYKRCLINGRIV